MKQLIFVTENDEVIRVDNLDGAEASMLCPECEEGTLVLTTNDVSGERHLECQSEECSRCYYQ